MFGKRCYDMPKSNGRDIFQNIDIEQNYNEINNMNGDSYAQMNNCVNSCVKPIVEKPVVRCVHRTINHTIPHV